MSKFVEVTNDITFEQEAVSKLSKRAQKVMATLLDNEDVIGKKNFQNLNEKNLIKAIAKGNGRLMDSSSEEEIITPKLGFSKRQKNKFTTGNTLRMQPLKKMARERKSA